MLNVAKPCFTKLLDQALACEEFPRHSEASLIDLGGKKLLLAWARKPGGDDFSSGSIIGMFSSDAGRTWDAKPHAIQKAWPGVFDVMSPSLLRSARGIHHFFAGRLSPKEGENLYSAKLAIFQAISCDEGRTWSSPTLVSLRDGYNILVSARAVILECGRIVIPIAFVSGPIFEDYDKQRVFCYYSDNQGISWHESNHLSLPGVALMEPSVAQCSDGSLYMSIRTKLGYLYEAKSNDDGESWHSLSKSSLASAEAPSTVIKDTRTRFLWIFWCNTPYVPGRSKWFERHDLAWAYSRDGGRTWSTPRTFEHNTKKSFGYVDARLIGDEVFLTYYDWPLDHAKPHFWGTSLRQTLFPVEWFDNQ